MVGRSISIRISQFNAVRFIARLRSLQGLGFRVLDLGFRGLGV